MFQKNSQLVLKTREEGVYKSLSHVMTQLWKSSRGQLKIKILKCILLCLPNWELEKWVIACKCPSGVLPGSKMKVIVGKQSYMHLHGMLYTEP